jgi:transketolase
MRDVFFKEFKSLMKKDKSLFFVTGDTGYHLVEDIIEDHPERALNIGVAEQNMIGVASGLVNTGFLPVCYAITNFLVERSFEQIRNDLCLHEYKAILVGTSTGYDNGALGATHHKVDDIGALKVLPNLRIYSPSGDKSMSVILKEAMLEKHSSFIRIPKVGIDEDVEVLSPNHFIRKSNVSPVLVISHGKMVKNSIAAHTLLPEFSIFAMDRIKPLDDKLLLSLFEEFKHFVIVEDNFRSGLYNSICQWAVENNAPHVQISTISPEEKYDDIVGNADYLEDKHGLSPKKISERIRQIITNI